MSLLNKMLRDLDARHAPPADRAALPNAVKARPAVRSAAWLAAGIAFGVAATLAVLYFAKPKVPAATAAQPIAAMSAPAASSAAVRTPPTPPAPQPVAPIGDAAAVAAPPTAPKAPVAAIASSKDLPAPVAAAKLAPAPAATPEKTKDDAAPGRAREARPPKAGEKAASEAVKPSLQKDAKDVPAPAEAAGIEKRPRGSLAGDAAEAEYEKAMTQLRRGANSVAADGLRAALRLNERHVSARQALLALLVEQRQWAEAEALLEEGLALDPAQSRWALALARLQLENGHLGAAADTLMRYARHAEQNADYQAFRALLAQKQKRPAEAADLYRAALALKPAESRWWYGLGLVLEAAQKPQEARDAYLKAKESGNLPAELAGAVDARLR